MKKKYNEFEAIKILEDIVKIYKKEKKKNKEIFDYWSDWIENFVVKPPWRDDIIKYNSFFCEIYYLFEGLDTEKHAEEITTEINRIINDLGEIYNLLKGIERSQKKKIISLKGYVHINLLMYLYRIETHLKFLQTILSKVILIKKGKFKIRSVRSIKSGDCWEFKDTSLRIPKTTTMALKEVSETLEINDINQISELYIREITNAFKQNGYPNISNVIDKFCNFNLRNKIAHSKYQINSRKREISFSDGSKFSFIDFYNEDEKLDILFRLIIVGIYLSIIIIDHNINLNNYRKKY